MGQLSHCSISSFRIYLIVKVLPRRPGSISSSRFHLPFVPSQPGSTTLFRFYLLILVLCLRSGSTFRSESNLSIQIWLDISGFCLSRGSSSSCPGNTLSSRFYLNIQDVGKIVLVLPRFFWFIFMILSLHPGSSSSSRVHPHALPFQPFSTCSFRFYLFFLIWCSRSSSTFLFRFNFSILIMSLVFAHILPLHSDSCDEGLLHRPGSSFSSKYNLFVLPSQPGSTSRFWFYFLVHIPPPRPGSTILSRCIDMGPDPTEHEPFKFCLFIQVFAIAPFYIFSYCSQRSGSKYLIFQDMPYS